MDVRNENNSSGAPTAASGSSRSFGGSSMGPPPRPTRANTTAANNRPRAQRAEEKQKPIVFIDMTKLVSNQYNTTGRSSGYAALPTRLPFAVPRTNLRYNTLPPVRFMDETERVTRAAEMEAKAEEEERKKTANVGSGGASGRTGATAGAAAPNAASGSDRGDFLIVDPFRAVQLGLGWLYATPGPM